MKRDVPSSGVRTLAAALGCPPDVGGEGVAILDRYGAHYLNPKWMGINPPSSSTSSSRRRGRKEISIFK